jgi:hypothetical protein
MEVTDESRACLGFTPICKASWGEIKEFRKVKKS